jgi:hypothetical protein
MIFEEGDIMLSAQVALVPGSELLITASNLTRVAAALQKQVIRDFGPIWEVDGTVDAFERFADVPLGYWPIILVDQNFPVNALGFHLDPQGQPLSFVRFTDNWSLTASHECLEMLADPFGNRLVPSYSLPNDPMPRVQGLDRVSYVVEVCDPCENADYAYTVNGVLVSDFYTPHYFDPEHAPGVRYDFTGNIMRPRQVLKGGYISWVEPTNNHVRQAQWFDWSGHQGLSFPPDLGPFSGRSLREFIDAQTPPIPEAIGLPPHNKQLQEAQRKWKIVEDASSVKAQELYTQLLTYLCVSV